MDERYRIILTIKNDLPFVAKEFEPETTLDEAIQWMKDNRKELHICTNDWFDRILSPSLKYQADQFLPCSRLLDSNGDRHIIMIKLERKQSDIINTKNPSKFLTDMSFDVLDSLLGWDWYENERTT